MINIFLNLFYQFVYFYNFNNDNMFFKFIIVLIIWTFYLFLYVVFWAHSRNECNKQLEKFYFIKKVIKDEIKKVKNSQGKSVHYKTKKEVKINTLEWLLKQINEK